MTAIAPLVPEKFRVLGHQRWTAMPVTGSPQWYSLVTSLILGVGIGCLAQPQLVVRFMTVESSKQLNRGVFIGCFFLIITVGAIYHAGALSNLFFLKTEGAVATEYVYAQFTIPYDGGASVGSDIYGTYKPRSRDKLTNVIRLGVLFSILVSYIICYMLPHDIIARGTSIFMGICAAAFLPAYFCIGHV